MSECKGAHEETRLLLVEKFTRTDLQRHCDLIDDGNRRVACATLDIRNVGPVKPDDLRKRFLRKP